MVGFRSTFATPRIPSVPNRRAIDQRPGVGEAAGLPAGEPLDDGLGLGGPIGTPLMTTVTLGGLAATSVVPGGTSAVTGTSDVPAASPVTSRRATSVSPDNRSRSAVEPPIVR